MCGLSLCCGTIANLSRDEIQQVVDFYRTEDGRVRYKEFCHMMENGKSVLWIKKLDNYIMSVCRSWDFITRSVYLEWKRTEKRTQSLRKVGDLCGGETSRDQIDNGIFAKLVVNKQPSANVKMHKLCNKPAADL